MNDVSKYTKANRLILDGIDFIEESSKERKKFMNSFAYVLDYRTLKLGLPRQCGKSTFIRNNAKAGDIIVVPNMVMKQMYAEWFRPAVTLGELPFWKRYQRGRRPSFVPETIWFDECGFDLQKNKDINDMLYGFLDRHDQRIICLGT